MYNVFSAVDIAVSTTASAVMLACVVVLYVVNGPLAIHGAPAGQANQTSQVNHTYGRGALFCLAVVVAGVMLLQV